MRIRLATMTTLAMTVLGCEESSKPVQPDASARNDALAYSDTAAAPADVMKHADVLQQPDTSKPGDPFELEGKWLYLGPWDGEHNLSISKSSIVYADIAGEWSSTWTITSYDNELHRFEIAFEAGTGTYYPVGEKFSGTYEQNAVILTVQLSEGAGSFLPVESAGSCTKDDATRIPDCRLYMSQN